MKKNLLTVMAIAMLMFGLVGSVQAATTIFSDNFDSETLSLNYTSFKNWTVSDGTVDLIGAGTPDSHNFIPGNGRYVDMDGSNGNAGKITTKAEFTLQPGNYTLSFDLAGNQRNSSTEYVNVLLGSLFSQSYSLAQTTSFQTFTNDFEIGRASCRERV